MAGKRKREDYEEKPKPAEWWDNPNWQIQYVDSDKSGKLSKAEQDLQDLAILQKSPFHAKGQPENALDTFHVVLPQLEWNSLRKYSNFIISGDQYSNKEYVWVRPSEEERPQLEDGEVEGRQFWVGKVLEVRAKDPSHVYAKIVWMYDPKELPKLRDQGVTAAGRRPYHGKDELVASNAMEVLDVSTFAGKANVLQWMEEDEEGEQAGLYWRQTFDHRNGGKLSELRKHCICREYYNPDKSMLACTNESCNIWLHGECLIDDVLTKTYDRLLGFDDLEGSTTSGSTKKGLKKPRKPMSKKKYEGIFSAELKELDGHPQVEITDLRDKRTWSEDIACPKCGVKIE